MKIRTLQRIIASVATSDGAGVKLRRSIGAGGAVRVDPFLMLDEFYSDNPDDYLAGFPSHPHRGFETVTYMLDGHMQHKDHLGNVGDIGPGGVQWMTAGRGIIHAEMPQQSEGRMRGFQLWINLPAAEKMRPGDYRDIPAEQVTRASFSGGMLRVIAGRVRLGEHDIAGPINADAAAMRTDPLYVDIHLDPGRELELPLPSGHNAFVYLYEGAALIGDEALPHRAAGVLGEGEVMRLRAGEAGARALLLAGRPLNEPVVQYGPFVMNSREEVEQAMRDYQQGRLTG
jgi:redox-sensitive bicupin YhaK (pirin superfamily)